MPGPQRQSPPEVPLASIHIDSKPDERARLPSRRCQEPVHLPLHVADSSISCVTEIDHARGS